MNISPKISDEIIQDQENHLREWFTRGKDSITRTIDGLDIGWGGVQRWATGLMPPVEGLHLDIACGYATFLAQLGWRFPNAHLIGLNIDFAGPHRLAKPLLSAANVNATLIQADARKMPFLEGTFNSASCFLGLQDIEIGFGLQGVKETLAEAVRVVLPGGALILLDEFSCSKLTNLCKDLPIVVEDHGEQGLDICWSREVAERAIRLYAEGWVAQAHPDRETEKKRIFEKRLNLLREDMEQQITEKGHYIPFGPIDMILCRKHDEQSIETSLVKCPQASHGISRLFL